MENGERESRACGQGERKGISVVTWWLHIKTRSARTLCTQFWNSSPQNTSTASSASSVSFFCTTSLQLAAGLPLHCMQGWQPSLHHGKWVYLAHIGCKSYMLWRGSQPSGAVKTRETIPPSHLVENMDQQLPWSDADGSCLECRRVIP